MFKSFSILAFASFVSFGNLSYAQTNNTGTVQRENKTPKTAQEISNEITRKLSAELNLTAEQLTQVKALNDEFAKMFTTRRDSGEDVQQIEKDLKPDYESRLQTIITADQWKIYEEKRLEDRKAKYGK